MIGLSAPCLLKGPDHHVFKAILCVETIVADSMTTSVLAQQTDEAGFMSLFDGRDLIACVNLEGDNGRWRLIDGVIARDVRRAVGDYYLIHSSQEGDERRGFPKDDGL